jgi:hypothetical protein
MLSCGFQNHPSAAKAAISQARLRHD